MSNDIDTVKVVADTPSGYAIINAQDYDADRHALYAEPESLPEPPESADAPGAQPLDAPAKRAYNRKPKG